MSPTIEILNELESTSSRNSKIAIISKAFLDGHRELFVAAKIALDPLVTFGIKKVPLIEDEDSPGGDMNFEEFTILLEKLRTRALTGHAARDALIDAAERSDAKVWNTFYRRILLKDFKVGMDVKTLNKALEGIRKLEPEASDFIVPVFSCQLAEDGNADAHVKKVKGRKLVDIKLDGARLLSVLKPGEEAQQYTRSGILNENFVAIREGLTKLAARLPGPVVLDSEVMAKSFRELMTQMNRTTKVDTTSARLAVFDIIPLKDFLAGRSEISQMDRHGMLTEITESGLLQETCGDLVYVVPKTEINLDTPEGRKRLAEFNADTLEAGYEGVMLKNPDAPYRCTRTDNWLKIKPWISVTLEIKGYEQGKPDGKFSEVLGAFICAGEFNGKTVETKVGSGFTEDMRNDFWNRRDELIGFFIEAEADGLTQNTKSDSWSLRFPVFKGFRGNEKGEIV